MLTSFPCHPDILDSFVDPEHSPDEKIIALSMAKHGKHKALAMHKQANLVLLGAVDQDI